MSKVVFERLLEDSHHKKDGYYVKDARFFRKDEEAHRTLLLDTGSSWITVSKVVAHQLGIDFRSEQNRELRRMWDRHGSENPYSFLHSTWKNYPAKTIPVTSTLADGEDIQSYLYPIELEMQNGFKFTSISNIIPREVDTPLFGIQPIMRYAEEFKMTNNGKQMIAKFGDSNTFNQVLDTY